MATLIPVLTVRRSCVIFLLLSAGLALRAQQLDSSETYYAVSAKGYGIADGLPDKCVQNVLVAPDGRLYVLPCTYTQVAHKLHFYQYDAFRARRQAVDIVPATGQWSLVHCGTQRDSTMYGYLLENSDPDQPKTGFFAYHVGKHSWTSRPAPEVDGQPVVLASVAEFKKHLYALGLLAGEAHVFRLQAETWERVAGTGPATLPASARTAVALFVDSSAIWFEAPQGVLYRISLRDGAVNSEPVFTSTGQGMLISNRLMRLPTGELVYAMHGRGVIYRLDDSRRDQVLFEPFFGPGRAMPATHYFLYRDLRGNTIWISEDPKEGTTAWLMDTEGQVHDFTPVVAALQGTMNQRWNHLELRGTDFTRNVWVVGRDLVSLDVSSRSGVKAHPSGPVRGVVELADGTWVLGRYRTFKSGRETNPDSLLPACFSVMHPDGDILRLGNGMTLHGTRGSGLRLYNRESDDCRTFFEGETVARICIGPDSTVFVLATNR
ncbi:MAG: hypothetical protein R3301_17870, partial [Saprospiraceae bacterium]|nr:hypothetical protein [Saprospiraceae bacterium]